MLVPGNRRTLSVLTTLELLQIIFRLLRRTDPTLPKVAEIVNLTMSRDFQDSSGLKVGLERVRNGPSVGGSFAARGLFALPLPRRFDGATGLADVAIPPLPPD